MGLDMYLAKKHYIQNWDHMPPEQRYSVSVRRGGKRLRTIKPELYGGEPVSLFAAAQRQLAAFYGADPMVSDPSRVMRVPGFLHQKGEPFGVQLVEADGTRRYTLREALLPHDGVAEAISHKQGRHGATSPEVVKVFRAWAAAAPRHEGMRNVTAFVMAAEGLKTGIPGGVVTAEVGAYCERAGIAGEAAAVLRSARRRAGR